VSGGDTRTGTWVVAGTATAGFVALIGACGGPQPVTTAAGGTRDARKWPADDRSMCQTFVHWKNNQKLEISETVGPGAIKPNVRRVYKVIGERDDRHSVLVCREIDSNLDGIKDVVRTFNEKGEPLHEEADTNYDGRVDDWVNFADGRIDEEDMDTTFSNGRPNVWKFYINGELSRVRRNTHCVSGKADTWEIYFKNRLERVGNDTSCDGHVDRWDRDAQLMAQEEAQVEVATLDAGTSSGTAPVVVGPNGEVGDGGPSKQADAGRPKRPR
jgi:hypothetical protein